MANLNIMENIRNIKKLNPDLSINDIKQMLNIMPKGMSIEDAASWFKSQARNAKKKTKQAAGVTKKEIDNLYSNAKKTIEKSDIVGKGSGKTTSGTRKALADAYNKVKKVAGPVGKVGAKVAGKAAGVGNIIDPIMSGVSTAFNWNKEGSDDVTRALDASGTVGALGGAAIGAGAGMAGGPWGAVIGGVIGLLAGIAADNKNKNAAAARRELNKMKNMSREELENYVSKNSDLLKQLSEEQQQDLDFYRETGVPIDRAMEMDNEPVNNQSANVTGNGVYAGSNTTVPSPADYSANPEIIDINLGPVPSTAPTSQSVQSAQDVQSTQQNIRGLQGMSQGQPTGGAANTITYKPYQSTVDYGISPQEYELMNKVVNQPGQVSQRDIYNTLKQKYAEMNNIIENRNPYYQGNVIPTAGYELDPNTISAIRSGDMGRRIAAEYAGRQFTPREQIYREQAMADYRDRIAQQAGVPYADYVKGITERNNALVKAQAAEIENILKFQLQQTSDMKEKMAIIQKINEVRVNAAAKIDEQNAQGYREIQKQALENQGQLASDYVQGQFDLQKQGLANTGSANVANINAAGNIAQEQVKLNDPFNKLDKIGRFTGNVSYANPNVVQGTYQALPSDVQQALYGKELKADQINTLYGLNTQQNMQQAQQDSNWRKFIRDVRGIQANEQ